MNVDSIRSFCLSMPHATENMQWGDDLCFKIAGKLFAVLDLNAPHRLSLKCTPERFAELVEIEGIIPAPYMARNNWVCVERHDVLPHEEMKELIGKSYVLVVERLPKKLRIELQGSQSMKKKSVNKRKRK